MRAKSSLVGALAVLLAGCPSTTIYRTADPVPPGRWQLSAAAGAGGMSDREQETRFPTGHFEIAARRGVAEDLDLGAKLYTVGAEVNATWRFARGRWSFALAPALGGARTPENEVLVDAVHLFAGGAVIASRPLSGRWTIGLGPLAGWGLYWPETGGQAQGGWLGGFLHADARLGERWHLTPELGFYRVFAGEVPIKKGGAVRFGASFRYDL